MNMAIKNILRIFILSLIMYTSIVLICNKSSDKVTLDEVKLKDNEVSKKQFAVYIRDSKDAEYQEYNEDNLFPVGYKLDLDESGCVDDNGEKVTTDGIITQTSDNKITLKSNKTVYCYLYFEKNSFNGTGLELAKSNPDGLKSTPEAGDLTYRFVGTTDNNPDNYICFGTSDKEQCTPKDSNYLYRIIGIDENGQLKIIKNSSIGSNKWHTNYTDNAVWDTANSGKLESELHQKLNGSTFLTNSSTQYVPNGWENKIVTTAWNIRDSKTVSGEDGDGIGYGTGKTQTGSQVWTWESSSTASTASKIGLMYLSDYYYSYDGSGNINCADSSNSSKCKSSWLHISNNGDNSTTSSAEWTMSRYGQASNGHYNAWCVYSYGQSDWYTVNSTAAVRPVFYLTANTKISSGSGTLEDPFMIEA